MADEPTLPADQSSPSSGEHAPSPSADVPSPSSSEPQQGETKESLLEAVQNAVPELRPSHDEERSDGGPGASPAQAARPGHADDDPELPDEIGTDELAKFSQSAKRRINKLNKQRQKLAGEVERLKSREPSAEAADQVTKYLRDNDIGRDDFLLTLELAAAMRRGDFKTFYEGITPYVRLAEEYLGIKLPPDLQQQVQQGQMTTDAAMRFSRERMDRAMAQQNYLRQQQTTQQLVASAQQQQQYAARENLANQVRDTVNAWEARVAQYDPDYAAKKPLLQDVMWSVIREQGAPQSPDHAVKIAEEALRRVNTQYRAWAPQRRPTSRAPSSTGRTAGVAPEPKSLAEAVKFAREGARL